MKTLNQWVCCDGKLPIRADGKGIASCSDSTTWCNYYDALRSRHGNGIGFVFTGNGIIGIDIDDCVDADGFLNSESIEIIERIGSYSELSMSGKGIHIYVRGRVARHGYKRSGLEIYDSGRFFVYTGKRVSGDSIIQNQDGIDWLVAKYFGHRTHDKGSSRVIYPIRFRTPKKGKIFLLSEYDRPIGVGMRNMALTSIAGQLRNCGYGKKLAYWELSRANRDACEEKLEKQELINIINSIWRYKK